MAWIQTVLLALLVVTQIPSMIKDHRSNACADYWLKYAMGKSLFPPDADLPPHVMAEKPYRISRICH